MKRTSTLMKDGYSSPEFTIVALVVDYSILVSSPVGWENNIKEPSWDTEGDFGLE